jgi:XTP/dITP diphosphohydrolase
VARLKRGCDLVVASHNAGKVREIADLLAPFDLRVSAAAALGLAEPAEIGDSFAANAALKATAAAEATGKPALADDSGLCVVALAGEPGIHSARWAGERRDFSEAMQQVWRKMQTAGSADRRARFVCALALAWPDGAVEIFEGEVVGEIVWPPRGVKGFGYDPCFVPVGGRLTFGEMEPAAKHAISHRAAAFRKLIDACLG